VRKLFSFFLDSTFIRFQIAMVNAAFIVAIASVLFASPARALWPQPRNLQTGQSALQLSPSFDITLSVPKAPSDLQDAVTRTKSFLLTDNFARLVVGRGAGDVKAASGAPKLKLLQLILSTGAQVEAITTEARKALGDRNEAYTLAVPADGSSATLTANTTLGLLRGLTTFTQLWYTYNNMTYTIRAPISIKDSPAYVGGYLFIWGSKLILK
jgi:hexosaminidase